MRRVIVSGGIAVAAIALLARPAAAHNEWDPETAAPGSIVELTLFAEDEQPDAGTTKLELQFPQPITVTALPALPGWTATVVGGQLGGPATGVTWEGGPEPGDVNFPITLGPLPAEPGRLQFKSIQTYDNGEVDRWIEDWPEGAPEPDHPGPVLELVAGGPGSIPATTATTGGSTTTTTTRASTTTQAEQAAGDSESEDEDDDSNALPIVLGVAVVALAAAGGAFAFIRSRRSSDTSDTDSSPKEDT
ncbi:MAG TPA: DUF1775 domain-containing protein [Acidimicrobiales bacterium]|jgi:hypothetical protein